MKSLKRLFGRKSTRKVTRRSPIRISRPIGYASHVERLEDRTLLASNILASLESSVNQPNDTTELVLNVGAGSSPTLGFEVKAAPGSVFDPAAIQIFDANTNAVIPLNLSEHDHDGSTNSLVLATLSPGEFRIEVQGQTAATGGFIVDVFLPGDSDGSGSVSDDEYRHALAASYQHLFGYNHFTTHFLVQQLGLNPSTNFYSPEMDGDMDGDVDNNDLNLMNANRNIPTVQFELIGDQDAPESFIELQVDSGISDTDGITNDLTIVGNLSDESQITQFKVGLDGAAFSSFVDILPQLSGGANGGSFTLTRSWLETNLNGGMSLEGGTHTLHFFAQDEHDNNNMGAFYDLTFELDTIAPTKMHSFPDFIADEDFGTGNLGDKELYFVNELGGTPLSFDIHSSTSPNPIVTLDESTDDLILESILHANGSTDIVIRAMDLAGNSVLSDSFNVTVNPLNDAPVAIDDLFTTNEDTVLNGASNVFAANPTTPDSDVENDPFTVTEVNGMAASVGNQITLSSGALLTLNANGTFSYDPNGQFENLADGVDGSDSFTYTIDDGTGSLVTTDTATVTITITGVNDDPVAIDDVFTTDENTVLTGGGVLAANPTTADSDVESQRLRVAEVNGQLVIHGSQITLPSGALLTMNDDGTFSYDPNGQFEHLADGDDGSDSFTYTITDAQGGTDSATVNLTITGVNDDPVAVDDAFTTDEDTELTGENVFAANPTTADSDVEGQSFTVTGVTGGAAPVVGSQFALTSGALLTLNANGTFSYDPNGAFEDLPTGSDGSDSFTYTITDAQGGTDTATVNLTITGVNDDPVAVDDAFTTDEDTELTGENVFATNPTTADSDPESQSFTVTAVAGGTVGSQFALGSGALLTINANGTFSYDPNGAFEDLPTGSDGSDSFTYTITDAQGGTDTATVNLTITGVNDDPVAVDDAFTTDEDTELTGGNVLAANPTTADSDPESQSFTVTAVAGGTVDSQFALASGALLTLNANGTFSYDPNGQFENLADGVDGSDSFTYTITDAQGGTDSATVNLTITGVNDDPVAIDDAFTTDENTVLNGASSVFTANPTTADSDVEGQSFTVTGVTGGAAPVVGSQFALTSGALLTINANGTFSYDPNGQFENLADGVDGSDSFTYTITDAQGGTDTATVNLTITGVNDDPVAVDDAFTTDEDTELTGENVFAANPTTADSDPESQSFTVTAVAGGTVDSQFALGSGALLTINANGTFSYDPNGAFESLADGVNGSDSFTYTITDSQGGTDTATVNLTITGVNDGIEAQNDEVETNKNTPLVIDVRLDNGNGIDLDPDIGDVLTVTEISDDGGSTFDPIAIGVDFNLDSGAILTRHANGTITYDPNGAFNGLTDPSDTATDTFTYTIDDGNSATDTATVTVTITGSNEDLMLTNPIADFSSDGLSTETLDLDNHFADADPGDIVTYQVVSATLVGGDVLPSDFWVNNVLVSGSDLNITFSNYSSDQVRLPVEITVRASSDDGLSADVDEIFILTPDPQTTAEVRLIARPTASSGRDFTGFRAEAFFGSSDVGGARLQLTNGLQDLSYAIYLADYALDIDGTDNGDPNDDLEAVRIIDTANGDAVLFTLFHATNADDSPNVDLTEDSLTGVWTAGEGLTSSIIDKLYAGELAIEVELGSGATSKASGGNIIVSPEVDGVSNLPAETTQFAEGSEYVVEIWLSDQLAQVLAGQSTETSSITSVLVDLLWDDISNVTGIDSNVSGAASAFGSLTGVDFPNNGTGEVADFSGITLLPGFATNGFARVGYATFSALAPTPNADPVEFTIDITPGDDAVTRGMEIDLSQISLVGTSVTQVATSEFFIQTDQSNISVTGTIDVGSGLILDLDPQSIGLDSTSLSGRFDVVVDDFDNPSTIQIIDSTVEVNPTGQSRPDRDADDAFNDLDLADFGLQGRQVIPNAGGSGFDGVLHTAIRDAIANVFSSEQAIDGGGLFDITEDWSLENGQIDSIVAVLGTIIVDRASEVTNDLTMTYFDPLITAPTGLSSWDEAKLTEVSAGEFELLIPISRRLSFTTSGGEDVVLEFVGSVTSGFLEDQSDQFGDTIATAESTGLSSAATGVEVYQGIIGNNGSIGDPLLDVDMFEVQLNVGDTVIVDVDADMFETDLDSVLRIFDASGNQVAASDDDLSPNEVSIADVGFELDSFISYTNTTGSAGFFYIGLSAFNEALSDNLDPAENYDPEVLAGRPSGVEIQEVGSYDITISVGTTTPPAPLHGSVASNSVEILTEGTAVDLVVVRNQTEVDSLGRVNALPSSDSWIDEWSSFWVEVYVETADAKGITDAAVDLNYNTNFFTATAIEFGAQFAETGSAVIDDTTGVVSSLSGIARGEKAGNGSKALLARVKFDSLEQDDVSINFEEKFIGPHALGLSLSNVDINLVDDAETNVVVSDAPETDLWAIAYDVNDDDVINFRDLMIFASTYGQNVLDANSPYVWALDADKSGAVNFRDLTYFASNYGVSKGGDRDVVYPANFLQRWYGKTTDITGESSIDEVMDVALGIWQDALGLDQPLDIQLVVTDLGGTQLGEGQITAVDDEGLPVAGIVTLDDDAAGLGWYSDIDTTAFGGTELEGGVAYTADAGSDAAGRYDLLTVLLHEIGHVAGFTETYAPFQSHIETGVGGTLSFVGSGFEATLTSDGLHLDETVHAGDIMNATLDPGVRKLPSILDALILKAAHETAASGSFEILVGVNAPLMANLPPAVIESGVTDPTDVSRRETSAASITDLVSNVISISNSLTELNESSLPDVSLTLNHLNLNSSVLDQDELDLTVLEGFSDELVSDLRLNGVAIVGEGEVSRFEDADLDDSGLDLSGFSEQLDAGFDDVFSDWAGPIL